MKNQLKISTDKEQKDTDILLLEIGNDHFNFALYDKATQQVKSINYNTTTLEEAEQIDVVKELKDIHAQQVIISSSFPQAILVPKFFFNNDYSLLKTMYDLPEQEYFQDVINEWQVVVIYGMPSGVINNLKQKYPDLKIIHSYTPAIKTYNGSIAENQISIHFTAQYFRVLVKKGQRILLIQTYQYKAPLDVVYYLLKICYEFEMTQSEVHLIMSGLLEKDSALFKELKNYFINLQFVQSSDINLPGNEHPHYYFTSLNNLISCAL